MKTPFWLAIILGCGVAGPAVGQCPLQKITVPDAVPDDRFGSSVAIALGVALLGCPLDDVLLPEQGSVRVFDLATGAETWRLLAGTPGHYDGFGWSVAASGQRAIVGAPEAGLCPSCRCGAAWGFDLRTGQMLFEYQPSDIDCFDQLGYSVAISGDRAIVGAPTVDGVFDDGRGHAYVLDMDTGQELFVLGASDSGGSGLDLFGIRVAIDGGTAVVCSKERTYAFDVATGTELWNSGGSGELAIDGNRVLVGFESKVKVRDAATGQTVYVLTGPPGFGSRLAARDGLAVIGSTVFAHVFDIQTGEELFELEPFGSPWHPFEGFVGAVSMGSGYAIIGSPLDDRTGSDTGAAEVYAVEQVRGRSICGPAVPNSTGAAGVLLSRGSAFTVCNSLTLTAARLPTNGFGLLLTSRTRDLVQQAWGGRGTLCLGGAIERLSDGVHATGAMGWFREAVDLTSFPPSSHAVLPGETWNFQAWFRDANPGPTSNFTDAVSVTFE